MKKIKSILIVGFLFCLIAFNVKSQTAGCYAPSSSAYLEINNVRALINNSSDMWWDLQGSPRYEVPKGSGKTALFAGSVWIGGIDQNGQLHVAAQRFRQDGIDFWSGPLTTSGNNFPTTNVETCLEYNKIYTVTRKEVKTFRNWFNTPVSQRDSLFPNYFVPQSIINWPAHGDVANNYPNYLAPFFDNNADGIYNPDNGDYPNFDLDGTVSCKDIPGSNKSILYGDVALWWVFNDKGNIHTETGGDALGIEVHAQAFAYLTNDDDINNTTFYNYEVYNSSANSYNNTYFGQWTDADLGWPDDDYIGCDVNRGLGYLYSADNFDGSGQPNTYGAYPPAVGIDFLKGPYKESDGNDDLTNWNNSGILDCNNGYRYDSISGNYEIEGSGDILNGNINGQNFGDNIIDNERWGIRKFMFYECGGWGPLGCPILAADHYNILSGKWKDNSNLLYGGIGWGPDNPTQVPADYMFPGNSDKCNFGTSGIDMSGQYPNGWSEVTDVNYQGDRRFVLSAGPFIMEAGEINDIMLAVVWARAENDTNLNASLEALKLTDDKIQKFFDNCFQTLELPDAPELTIAESDQQFTITIWNRPTSNNYNETYNITDPQIVCPASTPNCDLTYNFQGYKVFQLKNKDITAEQLSDTSKAKMIFQCDISDGISQITNYYWNFDSLKYIPKVEVDGANSGISNSFTITHNAFSGTNQLLENHKKYYFMAVAYAYNNYKQFNLSGIDAFAGQKLPYIESKLGLKVYEVMPVSANTTTNSYYGNEPEITQHDGFGCGNNMIDLDDSTITQIMNGPPWKSEVLKYKAGYSPIKIKVIDPLNVPIGEYEIKFLPNSVRKNAKGYYYYNPNINSDTINYDVFGYITDALWVISDKYGEFNQNPIGNIYSNSWISVNDLQIIPELGLSVEIVQTPYSFPPELFIQQPEITKQNPINNGFISTSIEFSDPSKPWLKFLQDEDIHDFRDWIKSGTDWTDPSSSDCNWFFNDRKSSTALSEKWVDKKQVFEKNLNANFAPYRLVSYFNHGPAEVSSQGQIKSYYHRLANVDLIITSDTSKWTRCPVLETTDNKYVWSGCSGSYSPDSIFLESNIGEPTAENQQKKLYPRSSQSVGKNGLPDNSGTFGMSWFPGYAIDVETGERLNLMFGESSRLTGDNGRDMIWNPSYRSATDLYWSTNGSAGEPIMGGKHFVYIMGHNIQYDNATKKYVNLMNAYDYGDTLIAMLNGSDYSRKNVFMNCMWVGIPLQDSMFDYLACDVKIKLRVVSPYRKRLHSLSFAIDSLSPNKGMPMYSFSTNGLVSSRIMTNKKDDLSVLIFPNPSNGNFAIKIDNSINSNAKYDIYSLEGRAIKSEKIMNSLQYFEISEKGIYIIKITNGERKYSQKIVVM